MAQSERRLFEVSDLNIQVACDLAVGSYDEELVYPDSTPVPMGRTEILMGVLDVKYKSRVREAEDVWSDEWVRLDVDIADLIAENQRLRETAAVQERELKQIRRRLRLYEDVDAGEGDTSTGE